MVYMAMGTPSKVETRKSPEGPIQVWIYKNMTLRGSGGCSGITYNTDHAGVSPGLTPPNMTQGSSIQQQAMEIRARGGQEGGNINNNAMAAATEIPDRPTGTLYVFLFNGRVFRLNLNT